MFIAENNTFADTSLHERAARYRKPVSVFVSIGCLLIMLVTDHSESQTVALEVLAEFTGFMLIGVGIIGRMWSTFYICGYKDDRIVTEGPYAIVRNPLYVFSFLGAMGLGLASENLIVFAVLLCAFLFYYPLVVRAEEKHLSIRFGQDYTDYANRVPRFFPRQFRIVESDVYPAKPRQFRRSLCDVMWFFWLFMIIQIIERMHQADWLPVWFEIL